MRRLHLHPRGRTGLVALVLLAAACAEEPVCLSPTSAGEVAAPPAPAYCPRPTSAAISESQYSYGVR